MITFIADMKLKKQPLFTLLLVVIAVAVHFYSDNAVRVENQYSTGIYPALSRFLRYVFGWLPFSLGDIIYGAAVLWLLWKTASAVKAVFKRQVRWKNIVTGAKKAVNCLLLIYIVFNLFWGINYNRVGIAEQLNLKMDKYSQEDLKTINGLLVEKVNSSKQALVNGQVAYPTKKELFSKVSNAYKNAAKVYPFLQYKPASVKPSMWGWVGNYMGFTGYYNPFTGEAQVNTLVPKFLQPFTTCHEVAHQLGYAKEMEANFVGYLSGTASTDTLLHYSVYLDLFMYSNRNLFETDSVEAKKYRAGLSNAVIADLKEWKKFNNQHKSPFEPVFRFIYGVYLERNQQPQGVLSYDEVTGFIIAYYRKYGKL